MALLDETPVNRSLPSAVDNTADFPTPGNQGTQNSCVGWAVGYALKSNCEYKKRNWTISASKHKFSPGYIFNQLYVAGTDGIKILDAMRLVESQGVCTLTYFPYNQNNCTTQPNAVQKANAALYKASDVHTIATISQIKSKIADGVGVVIGVKAYPDLYNLDSSNRVYDDTSGTAVTGHALCLVGYDDSVGGGAFKFINSWGTGWGLNGYGWISYNTVRVASGSIPYTAVGYWMESPATDNYLMGDLDNNGTVDTVDARSALSYSEGLISLTARQKALADVDGNGKVTTEDARVILQYASGIIGHFPLYN